MEKNIIPSTISFTKQSYPGKPKFTEKDAPDLTDKVIIITGSNTGIGKELAQLVYSRNAKVYMLARSEDKTLKAIEGIKAAVPSSRGSLTFIRLDLADLTSIKTTAAEFLRHESQLHVLYNNAGLGYPDKPSETKQGYELQLGVNCIGPFLLTQLLTPVLASTAKTSPSTTSAPRVVWVSSSAAEVLKPKGFVATLPKITAQDAVTQYAMTKLGNYLHATEYAARHASDGIVSVSLNPGNLDSDFLRDQQGTLLTWILRKTVLYPPVYGAYTELFAGVSPEVTLEKSGSFLAPWGKFWTVTKCLADASKSKAEGGTGDAKEFWEWSEAQVKSYL